MTLDWYRSMVCVQVMVYLAAANILLEQLDLTSD